MALTTSETFAGDTEAAGGVSFRAVAFLAGRLWDNDLFYWADGTDEVAVAPPNYVAWAPGMPRGDGRTNIVAGINKQNSKLYFVDYYYAYYDYKIGAICQIPQPSSGNMGGWPLNTSESIPMMTHR